MKALTMILAALVLITPTTAQAQEGYVRYDLLYHRTVFKDLRNGIGFSIGYDRQTTDRTMWGVMVYSTYNSIWQALENYDVDEAFTPNGVAVDYKTAASVVGLVLHSDYAFSDMDRAHLFFGPTTGLIRVGYNEEIVNSFDPFDSVEYTKFKESKFIVPLGLRLGFRTPGMWSFYGGAGLNFGNGIFKGHPDLERTGTEVAPSYFEFGIAGIW